MLKHLNIRIYGDVQGVSFRYYSAEEARKLDLKGFVRNQPDGSVYIEAEGEEGSLDNFVQWCYQGSDYAKVEKVGISEGRLKHFKEFEIK